MKTKEFFPQKLALGTNFCNRNEERHRLQYNIEGVRPTLIMSPRRYGKTSLGVYVIKKLGMPYTHLDLFPLANSQDVKNYILGGVGEILAAIESTPAKAFKAVTSFFASLNISFKIVGTKVEVDFMRQSDGSSKTILNALKKLDAILQKKNKTAILFLDEFQRLVQMPDTAVIEGALRNVAQQSNHLVFIFSGSNRHLLGKMFDDRNRPLYKLCDRIILNRISRKDNTAFIHKMAKRTWKKDIDAALINTILDLTECHPYYVNTLCSRLWRSGGPFTEKDILVCWHNYAIEEKSTVFNDLESLSANQLKLLITLARYGGTSAPLGDEFLSFAGLPLSSTRQALKVLEEKDYIYQDERKTRRILDPLVKYVLVERPD